MERSRWRSPDNAWRKFGVPALPTLYKVTSDGVSRPYHWLSFIMIFTTLLQTWTKLVEEEVYDEKKLDQFVASG